jgi:hypothetical protein
MVFACKHNLKITAQHATPLADPDLLYPLDYQLLLKYIYIL